MHVDIGKKTTAAPRRAIALALALVLALSLAGVPGALGGIALAEALAAPVAVNAGGSDGAAAGSEGAASLDIGGADANDGNASGESGSSGEGSGGEAGAEEQGGSEGSQQGSDQADGQAAEGSDAGGASAGENGVVGEGAAALLSDERGSVGENNAAEDGASLLSANEASTLAELKSAITSAPDGSTIQLKADIAIDSQVSMGMATAKSLTIDGSGAPAGSFALERGAGYSGYLFRIDNGNSLSFENVRVDGLGIAGARSLVYLTNGSVRLGSGALFQNSYSIGNGGAINAIGGSVEFGAGATVANNRAAGGGGGVNMTAGSLVLESGSLISNNNASGDGGGVNVYTGASGTSRISFTMASGATVRDNSAANGGGVVVRPTRADDSISVAGTISGNRASTHGGGLFVNPRTASTMPVAIAGAVLSGNYAENAGGGFYLASSNPRDSLTLTGVSMTNNTAKTGGGAYIYHRDSPMLFGLIVTDATVSGNSASDLGGGMYVAADGALDAAFARTAVAGNGSGTQGGGLWLIGRAPGASSALSLIDGTSITSNTSGTGGGLYYRATTETSSFGLSGGAAIEANEAVSNGGGAYLQGSDTVRMQALVEHASVSDNEQTGQDGLGGGGLYLSSVDATFGAAANVADNRAAMRGGGAMAAHSAIAMEPGSAVSGNTAGHNGGGFFIQADGSLATAKDSSVASNSAVNGGGAFAIGGSVSIGGSVNDNTATSRGGGIHVTNEGELSLLEGSLVSGNVAADGGGVALTAFSQGTIAGTVSSNQAGSLGGGVFYGWPWNYTPAAVPATLDLRFAATARIEDNGAANGAGLYATGAGNAGATAVRATIEGATFEGNEAKAKGGGAYVATATLDIESGLLAGNASGENRGHDLWVDPASSSGGASEGATVNLDVGEESFSDDADRDKVLIGAGPSGTVSFLQDFTMKNHLLLQSTAADRSTATVAAGAVLTLSGKLTVGVDGGGANHELVVDPNGGSVLYKNDAEASGADPLTGDTVADMYAFPGSSATVYLQWPDRLPDRADEPFKGWSDDGSALANRGVEYLTLAGDAAVAAQWGAYAIRYFDEDGVTLLGSLEPSEYAYGAETTTLPEPVREGYRFVAWYEGADHSGAPVASFANADREDKAYFAKWEASPVPPGPTPPDPDPDPTPDPADPKPSSNPGSGSATGKGASMAVTGDSLIGLGVLGLLIVLAGAIVFMARRRSEN